MCEYWCVSNINIYQEDELLRKQNIDVELEADIEKYSKLASTLMKQRTM